MVRPLIILAFFVVSLAGQGLTGRIAGSVLDATGAGVPQAEVTLTNQGTGQRRQVSPAVDGAFAFLELLPGSYSLSITHPGFRRHEQKDIVLNANERVVLRQVTLTPGDVSQAVTVTADAPRIESQSSERSGVISQEDIQDLSLKSRDYMGLLSLLPGVVDTNNREAPGWNNLSGVTINGNREGSLNLTLDGVSNRDTGSGTGPYLAPGLDAIGEVKVLLSNYQAEYGRSSGGTINVVVKSGTKQFHGTAFYYFRHEFLNANGFFFNRDGLPRGQYRFNSPGYTIGGPIKLPGKMRDKLFFFWSQEWTPRRNPTRVGRLTMPTALERAGDFTQTRDLNRRLIQILDPLNGRIQFPGNIVPPTRIDPAGQGVLNLLPLPNTVDPQGTYNTAFQSSVNHPRRDEILRLDYNLSPSNTFYVRGIHDSEAFQGDFNMPLASNVFPQLGIDYTINSRGLVSTLIHTFEPTLINETTVGVNHAAQDVRPLNEETLRRNDRSRLGLPQFFPQNNPYNLVPQATFGGITNAPSLNIEQRFPFRGRNTTWNLSNNVTKHFRQHQLKAGLYVELTSRDASRATAFNGSFAFGRSVNANFDSNYAFSNALLGSVTSYSEADAHPHSNGRFQNYEWFVQDNFRVRRRFSIDLGARFYRIVPTYVSGQDLAYFALEDYQKERAPLLFVPYRATPTSPRVGYNPVTGQTVSEVLIGTFVPGTGDIYNGMRVRRERAFEAPPIQFSPRVGFAWDIFGDNRTALRGGVGIYPDRFSDDQTLQLVQQPPLVNTSSIYNTTIRAMLTAPLSLSPSDVIAIQTRFKPPAVYNWSFGVQRDIGWRTMLDVAYVGNVGRHLLQRRQLNAFPYGTNFSGNVVDPTVGDIPLPPNFLRPIRGYGNIGYIEMASSSNYHSMQTKVNRRFSTRFTFNAVWTWSKAMDLVDGQNDYVNPFLDFRKRNYGKAGFDRTHNFVLSYVYRVPRLTSLWRSAFTRFVGDGWELTGVTRAISGRPLGLGYSFLQNVDITGTAGVAGVDTRVNLTGNPVLPKSERTIYRHFRTEVVRPPTREEFGIGNAPKDPIRGPGFSNYDVTLVKNFAFGKRESKRVQFRFEMYNALNQVQFDGVDTTARFDNVTGDQVNGRFGEYTSARDARRIQLGLRFQY